MLITKMHSTHINSNCFNNRAQQRICYLIPKVWRSISFLFFFFFLEKGAFFFLLCLKGYDTNAWFLQKLLGSFLTWCVTSFQVHDSLIRHEAQDPFSFPTFIAKNKSKKAVVFFINMSQILTCELHCQNVLSQHELWSLETKLRGTLIYIMETLILQI